MVKSTAPRGIYIALRFLLLFGRGREKYKLCKQGIAYRGGGGGGGGQCTPYKFHIFYNTIYVKFE